MTDLSNVRRANVFYLNKRLLTCKIVVHAIRYYESISERFYQSNRPEHGCIAQENSNDLRRWLTTSISKKIEVFDILLCPLNATDDELLDLQQRILASCTNLNCGFEPRVGIITDNIHFEEFDSTLSKEDRDFWIERNEKTCALSKKVAPIRFYVLGAEDEISCKHSQSALRYEPDNAGQNSLVYDQSCHFIQFRPAPSEKIHKLVHDYDCFQKMTAIIPIEYGAIEKDDYFLTALKRSHTTIENREMIANYELSTWMVNYYENSTEFSSELQKIERPQDTSTAQMGNETKKINKMIRYSRMNSSDSDNNA